MERRVVITGLGAVTPIGNDVDTFWENLKAGKCGITKITKFDSTDFKAHVAAEVKDFDPLLYMDKGEVRKNDPFSQFAIAAATQAVNDSEIMGKIDPERFGVYFGSGIGGIQTFSNQMTALNEKGPRRVSAYFIPMLIANIAGGNIAIKFNAQGSCLPITTACATSNNEIGEAYRAIKHGYLDAIIAGLLGGIIGARLYYVIFYPGDKYITNPMEIFNIKEGGLGIYGGIIGGMLCGGIVAKIRKMNLFAVLDVASLGYLIGQGVGRWGNFVNQEAFGCATDLPWGMYSDRTAAEVVGNVHPCFLYESILCLLGFVLLHLFTRHLRRYDGQTFLLYIIWYGVTRFFIEGLRTDSLLLPGIDLRVSQVLAAASALVAAVLLIVFRNCHKLTGCGSRKAMEAAGLTVEDKAEKVEIDDTAESTIFSGMSAEEAQEHMTVGTGVKKAAEAENEKTEGNADANTSEEPSDEAEEANETAEGESEEKNDGSEN